MSAVLVDSNVLIYEHDRGEYEKQGRAIEVLDHLQLNGSGYLSVQSLAEFFNIATRGRRPILTAVEAARQVEQLAQTWRLLDLTTEVVLEAIRGVRGHRRAASPCSSDVARSPARLVLVAAVSIRVQSAFSTTPYTSRARASETLSVIVRCFDSSSFGVLGAGRVAAWGALPCRLRRQGSGSDREGGVAGGDGAHPVGDRGWCARRRRSAWRSRRGWMCWRFSRSSVCSRSVSTKTA